jgi:aspartate racemase
MKTIGLLGGMSWESTALYYRIINEAVKQRLGGLHSAPMIVNSVDFHSIERLQREARWDEAGRLLGEQAQAVERAGADLLVLCTNTMHKVATAIEGAISIPLLHIADTTASAIARAGISKVGLLGTRFTMEQEFYVGRLREHGLDVLVPDADGRELVHRVIYDELCLGRVLPESRQRYRDVIAGLVGRGAQGILLGCTEITMLVVPEDCGVPAFDTTALHALAAVDAAQAMASGEGMARSAPGT